LQKSKGKQGSDNKGDKKVLITQGNDAKQERQRDEPVKEPTESQKKRREAALEKDKREKIEQGFYQEHSDEDDTLEPIKSLKEEKTDESQSSK
uniref:DUF3886 domain-containing protein n=1 Tax=Anisakis simplex TaxID=6269 RepID=A0A0M3JDM8_ANISI